MDPTSVGRYRVQFTATAELKGKLELARDLSAHRNPGQDLAPIIESAVDLLIEKLLKQRTGKTNRGKPRVNTPARQTKEETGQIATPTRSDDTRATPELAAAESCSAKTGEAATEPHRVSQTTADLAIGSTQTPATQTQATQTQATQTQATQTQATQTGTGARSRRVDAPTRRMVAERDGLRCTYVDDEGRPCDARAFLEYDHRVPAGMGGGSDADNVRFLCRAHNRLAAEIAYGRSKIATEIERKRRPR